MRRPPAFAKQKKGKTIMKKEYIEPSIKVAVIDEKESLLAASPSSLSDVPISNNPVDNASSGNAKPLSMPDLWAEDDEDAEW